MNTPISVLIEGSGEEMWIRTAVPPAKYDPRIVADYDPGQDPDPGSKVMGAIASKKMREGMPATAETAVVIEAYALPKNLQPKKSFLFWTGILYTIVSYRERRYGGAIDGYTLFLAR